MRSRILFLGLACLFILSFCKSPVSSNSSEFLEDTLAINYFMANPANISLGKSSMLSWEVMNATKVSIDNGIGGVPLIGEIEVHPKGTITYKLTASKNIETLTASCEVTVDQNVACVTPIEESCYDIGTSELKSAVRYEGVIKNVGEKTAYHIVMNLTLETAYGDQHGYGVSYQLFPPMGPGDIQTWHCSWKAYIDPYSGQLIGYKCDELELKYDITWDE